MQSFELMVAAYMRALDVRGDVELLDVVIASGTECAATVRIARFELPCTDGSTLWLAASLGFVSPDQQGVPRHHYVALGSSRSLALPKLVAGTFHFERFVAPLAMGHTFPLAPQSQLTSLGYSHAVLIAPTFEVNALEPPGLGEIHLLQVVPIRPEETELERAEGVDALLEKWDDENKDVALVDEALTD